ncbi:hypothetical protein AA958_26595 [Streptomyces sp. CNQ-509]|uniref:hypothetical protein n=1 Tax=unclassified Streptomyces TaxID=2593676 RepID=UPI00062DEA9E|nr:hypothetical protein [Streptomyces sp. CNQ-509]AKH85208.1 hypothetical protein AA958_26595 [Streptomyces sp. CNQ-509]
MGVFAKLLRRGGSSGEGQAAKEPAPAAEPPAGEAAATAAQPEAPGEPANAEAAAPAGIPKQQSAEGAADSDAGDEARK